MSEFAIPFASASRGETRTSDSALAALMQANLAEMRAIKTAEMKWLDRYSFLALSGTAFLIASREASTISPTLLSFGFLIVSMWFQDILRKERRSYFRVARSVVRVQNYIGLFQAEFLPESFADPFPKGIGTNPDRDGTQTFSSFLRRQVYVFLLFGIFVGAAVHGNIPAWPCILALVVDAGWLLLLFKWDRDTMINESIAERHLAGTSATWFSRLQL